MYFTFRQGSPVDAKDSAPRFEPRTGWSALPVQPPSGYWQLRLARVYWAFVVNILILVVSGFVAHQNAATWIVFWIAATSLMVQCVLYLGAAVRGGQLERRERKLGYTTWVRKR